MCSSFFPMYEQLLLIFLASSTSTSFRKKYFLKRREQQIIQSTTIFPWQNHPWTSLCCFLPNTSSKYLLFLGEPKPQWTTTIPYQPIMLYCNKFCRKQLCNTVRKSCWRPETSKCISPDHIPTSSIDKWFLLQQRYPSHLSKVKPNISSLDGSIISTHSHLHSVLSLIMNSIIAILLLILSNSSTVLLISGMESLSM